MAREGKASVRRVSLLEGSEALVDAADFAWLSRHRWTRIGPASSPVRREGPKGTQRVIWMHREIPGLTVATLRCLRYGRWHVLRSVDGVYRNGRVELSELPSDVHEGMRVIVTFVEPRGISLGERGIDQEQATKLRSSLAPFADDWESPEMEAYDDYDAARNRGS